LGNLGLSLHTEVVQVYLALESTLISEVYPMPIIKSAKKRVKTARKAAARNRQTKRGLKGALKTFQAAITDGKKVGEAHAKAQSALAKAGKKGVLHKNKVARKQRQLAAKLKATGATPKTAAKKTVEKATTAKTSAKTAVKKVASKKPAAKKPTKK
jgi:small subunit ribosomal protein S20